MIKAGAGFQIINPPLGTSLGGYFYERPCSRIHDDLMVKSLVLDDGDVVVAVAVCDLQAIEDSEVSRTREIVCQATGISPDHIFISATHTHTGPQVRRGRVVPVNDKYLDELPTKIADSIIQAYENVQPAVLRLGEEIEERIAFNRRYRMRDGTVKFNPAKKDPDILGPDGCTDPQVNLLRVDDEKGQPIAILVNYALHPDIMGGCEASADFPGEMSRILASIYGGKPMVMYLQGACGNINQRDIGSASPQVGWKEVLRVARTLAGKALSASELSKPIEGPLAAAKCTLKIPYHPLTHSLRQKAERVLNDPGAGEFDRAQARHINAYTLAGKDADVEVQAIRIAETAIVGIPGEYFVEYGLSIKEWSPFPQTFVVELANNTFGYIPTSDAFHPGTYETMPILSASLEPTAGIKIANAAIGLLRRLAA